MHSHAGAWERSAWSAGPGARPQPRQPHPSTDGSHAPRGSPAVDAPASEPAACTAPKPGRRASQQAFPRWSVGTIDVVSWTWRQPPTATTTPIHRWFPCSAWEPRHGRSCVRTHRLYSAKTGTQSAPAGIPTLERGNDRNVRVGTFWPPLPGNFLSSRGHNIGLCFVCVRHRRVVDIYPIRADLEKNQ